MEDKFEDFFKKANEISSVIKEQIKNNGQIKLISHLDTDGITAAGIIGNALYRADASFHIQIIRQLEENIMATVSEGKEHINLIIFTDLGSGQLDFVTRHLDTEKPKVIILDHHPPMGTGERVLQLNPHFFGINGSTKVSGAGVCYFVAKEMGENIDLSALAVVGAIGDRQDKGEQGSFTGLNAKIVEDAVNAKVLEFKKDLRLFGRETRPVHTALEYTTDPYIPSITGNRDACFKLLVELQIPLKKGDEWRTIADLTIDERTKLVSALITRSLQQGVPSEEAQNIVGNVYTLLSEKEGSILRDAREFASCINACGRMERAGVGVALCLGDRERAYKEAEDILSNYRTRLSDYLTLMSENTERITDLQHVQIFDGKELVDDRIIGTIVSLARSSNILSSDKIVFGIARQEGEDFIKISGRSTQKLVDMGIDIGMALSEAAEHIEGAEAGGHDIAAGARIPIETEKEFIKLVCKNIDEQFAKLGLVKNDHAK